MKVLLTGAAGFIGSFVARELAAQGNDVIAVDNINDYYDQKLKRHRLELLGHEKIEFHEGDIEDESFINGLFKNHKIETIYNLAARAGVRSSMVNPHVYFSTNVTGTLNILNAMKDNEVKKIVLASTSSLYAGQPMPFNEDLPVNTPISPYAASKKAAEVLCYSYHYLYNIDVSIVRYFTVYGPAGRPDMCIFRFIKWIDEGTPITLYGDGEQARDFTYVEDVAKGTISASKNVGFEVFNIGGGNNPISLNYVIDKIEKKLGKKAIIENHEFHKADIKETWANISKAKKFLNWEPVTTFEKGLNESIDWYLENKPWLKEVKV